MGNERAGSGQRMTKQEKQIGSEATGSTGAGRGKAEGERWDYDNAQATAVQLW